MPASVHPASASRRSGAFRTMTAAGGRTRRHSTSASAHATMQPITSGRPPRRHPIRCSNSRAASGRCTGSVSGGAMPSTATPMLPADACDTHSHIYPPAGSFPLRPGQRHEPHADVADYLATCQTLGVGRHVILQGKAYAGPAATLDAVARIGRQRARAMLFLDARPTESELQNWQSGGVSGFRFLFPSGAPVAREPVELGASVAAEMGWHIVVQAEAGSLNEAYGWLRDLPCPVVIDHLGRQPPDVQAESPEFVALHSFLADGGWIKIASPYNLNADGSTLFDGLAESVQRLVAAAPERCVWGMNFPHPNLGADGKPDEIATLASLLSILPEGAASALFVHNPARLYRF
ncbi:MAG: hypothetical protein EOP19_00025 [Hyphomicrobiales bacterium]|nr:MAG: hypothetical protein EOP19_00025 [Hyphomicrobiales bacterium]